MLGIIHRDRDAEGLLRQRLASLKPDVITLEFSRYGLEYRKENRAALHERLNRTVDGLRAEGIDIDERALGSVLSYIDVPSEYAVAAEHSAAAAIPLHLLDVDRFSKVKLQAIDELLARDNLSKLLSEPHLASGGHREATIARLFFEKGVKAFAYTREMRVRDRHMGAQLARLLARRAASHIVHICGWQHLCDPDRFYEPLHPAKAFIYDEAVCI